MTGQIFRARSEVVWVGFSAGFGRGRYRYAVHLAVRPASLVDAALLFCMGSRVDLLGCLG